MQMPPVVKAKPVPVTKITRGNVQSGPAHIGPNWA